MAFIAWLVVIVAGLLIFVFPILGTTKKFVAERHSEKLRVQRWSVSEVTREIQADLSNGDSYRFDGGSWYRYPTGEFADSLMQLRLDKEWEEKDPLSDVNRRRERWKKELEEQAENERSRAAQRSGYR